MAIGRQIEDFFRMDSVFQLAGNLTPESGFILGDKSKSGFILRCAKFNLIFYLFLPNLGLFCLTSAVVLVVVKNNDFTGFICQNNDLKWRFSLYTPLSYIYYWKGGIYRDKQGKRKIKPWISEIRGILPYSAEITV